MPEITLLSQETIDKIAAGEVVERPSSVVKELVENAIDAKATAITVEVKEGGISFIRITDNGCGIERAQVPVAFLRHSTSKIKSVEDLMSITSLGFRGEALSSIAAVSQVELITKTYGELTGTRYVIEGSKEKENEEIGAPEGTTFIVRNLFYNTPARRKFLKTAQTEGNYINDLMERLALSHPDVSFKFINNGQTKMHTSGNSREKDMIYHIYGRDITSGLLEIDHKNEYFHLKGFIGKPIISRGNRNFENYFINGRYIKSALLSKSIEEAYKGFLMQHQYPFCVLYFTMDTDLLDVNVHPTKMELRFSNNEAIYKTLFEIIRGTLTHKDFIPEVPVQEEKVQKRENIKAPLPEPFERRGVETVRSGHRFQPQDVYAQGQAGMPRKGTVPQNEPVRSQAAVSVQNAIPQKESAPPENLSIFNSLLPKKEPAGSDNSSDMQLKRPSASTEHNLAHETDAGQSADRVSETNTYTVSKPVPQLMSTDKPAKSLPEKTPAPSPESTVTYEQQELAAVSEGFLTKDAQKRHKIIGQLFDTYWMVEYEDKLFIIDQHAAHEKVLYEKTMKKVHEKTFSSQTLSPPIILTLSLEEIEMLEKYKAQIDTFGYEIEPFGGKEYAVTAIPADFTGIDTKTMFLEMLDDFANINGNDSPNAIMEKVASMSCKAAIKGNQHISRPEAERLIDELLELENPYNCPHGRPTIISMTKYEIEKKFKRIV